MLSSEKLQSSYKGVESRFGGVSGRHVRHKFCCGVLQKEGGLAGKKVHGEEL